MIYTYKNPLLGHYYIDQIYCQAEWCFMRFRPPLALMKMLYKDYAVALPCGPGHAPL